MKILFAIMAFVVLAGCTAIDTCATVDAAHEAFLAEVKLSPDAYSEKTIRNERLAYTTAKLACTAYGQRNPVAN